MNERDRIELLMKCYELSPSQFADRTGIQRASVSHILSGRNKPSLEVMLKIYESFPGIDMKWLMTGVGEEPVAAGMRQAVVNEGLFSDESLVSHVTEQPVVQPRPEAVGVLMRQEQLSKPPQQPKSAPARQSRKTIQQRTVAELPLQRRIKEVRIFYSDGTYETLVPEK